MKEMVMPQKLTVRQFFQRFSDDDTCLAHVMEMRYGMRHTCGKCGKDATFHQLSERPAFACAQCGAHVYPCAGTILQDTRTPLQLWFYAIYLFVATRHGVSGKELQRQLGVTYKTAWRMGQQIRKLMANANGFEILTGHVEIDESYVGGHRPGKRGRGAEGKTIVVGMKERGGRMVTEIVPDVKKTTLRNVVARNIATGATVSTDEPMSYGLLDGDGYKHGAVRHSAKEWSYYDYRTGAKHHTNSVEGFWRHFKAAVRGTHIHISQKHMAKYLSEFSYRANNVARQNAMFDHLIARL
jgi:transposase-like protein